MKYIGQKCGICEAVFPTKQGLRSHERSCKKFPSSSRKCDHCGRTFYTYSIYKTHMDHVNRKLRVNCKICNKTLSNTPSLKRHMKLLHPNNEPGPKRPDDWFKCEVNGCDRRFKTKGDLKKHNNVHSGEKRVTCWVCSVSCWDKISFRNHLKTQHIQEFLNQELRDKKTEKQRKWEKENSVENDCVFCGKKCGHKSNLFTHLQTHTGERPCICKYCGKEYYQNGDLGRHYIKKHGQKGLRSSKNIPKFRTLELKRGRLRYSCSVCLIQGVNPVDMIQHVVLVHGANAEVGKKGKKNIRNAPTHGCYVCGRRFRCRVMSRIHIRWCELDHGLVLKEDIPVPKELEDLKKPEFQPLKLIKKAKEMFAARGEHPNFATCPVCLKDLSFSSQTNVIKHIQRCEKNKV